MYRALRGRELLGAKGAAVMACAEESVGVVLVPTLVPGVNTDQVGDIIRFGLAWSPTVRGVHFQPVSYFGRVPALPGDGERYTMGQLLDDIVGQTGGLIPRESLVPSACDHPLCGLHGDYIALPRGRVYPLSNRNKPPAPCCGPADPAQQNRDFIGSRWSRPEEARCCPPEMPT